MVNVRFNSGFKNSSRAGGSGATRALNSDARAQMRDVLQTFKRFVEHVNNVTPEIIKDGLQPAFNLSQVYVPKDTLKLMRSGFLEARREGTSIQVEIGYGKNGFPYYAGTVHERVEVQHAAPTRSKYLEAALIETSEEVQKRILNGMREIAQ